MVVVALVGAGKLGGKIAADLAWHGHNVRVWDSDQDQLDALRENLDYDRDDLDKEKLMLHKEFVGQVYCFSDLEEALREVVLVIEAMQEDLEAKQDLFKKISHIVSPKAVLTSNSMNLTMDDVFMKCIYQERCIGMRHLYPVLCMPEVELQLGRRTSMSTLKFCLDFLSRQGKTGFFRSGSVPLVLTEDARTARVRLRKVALTVNSALAGREQRALVMPELAHAGNFAPHQDDPGAASATSALSSECVICMDDLRGCVLRPCKHLCTCAECGKMLVSRKDACPICREKIKDTVQFYRS